MPPVPLPVGPREVPVPPNTVDVPPGLLALDGVVPVPGVVVGVPVPGVVVGVPVPVLLIKRQKSQPKRYHPQNFNLTEIILVHFWDRENRWQKLRCGIKIFGKARGQRTNEISTS